MADLAIQCECGAFRAAVRDVSSSAGNRVVCYCDDCQTFPHHLGCSDTVLDSHGGTDIFQTSPAKFEISEGAENLALLRLTEGGLARWYASCCDTPICNTMARPGVPFVGVILRRGDEAEKAAAVGPVRGGVNARFAKGDRSLIDAHDRAPVSMLLRLARMILGARLRGDHKRSPFFDGSGTLSRASKVLSPEELAAAEAARDAA